MMSNRLANVEYSRYMRVIGEQEAPISCRNFNYYDVDIILKELDDLQFKTLQESRLTDLKLEEIVTKALYSLWKEEYISIRSWDINMFNVIESDVFTIGGIAEPKNFGITDSQIYLTISNLDLCSKTKPKIIKEKFEPKIVIHNNVIMSLDSFSKYCDSLDKMELL